MSKLVKVRNHTAIISTVLSLLRLKTRGQLTFALLSLATLSVSQQFESFDDPKFRDTQAKFNDFFSVNGIEDNKKLWKAFKRWEHFMEPRSYPNGDFDPSVLWKEHEKLKFSKTSDPTLCSSGNWTPIGPFATPTGGVGVGRLNVLQFDPNNSDIIYVGAADGGLWKSTNAGSSWSSLTSDLPTISVSDLVIDPTDTQHLYMATGDGFGYVSSINGGNFWGGTYSIGILESWDGGITWSTTGLNWNLTSKQIIRKLVIHPSNPDILLTATSIGLLKSSDGGATWQFVSSGSFYDIEFHPANPAIIYASSSKINKSTDGGDTWIIVSSFTCTSSQTVRLSIAVTPAAPSTVYGWCSSGNFFKSDDEGSTWQTKTSTDQTITSYGYYDLALTVSPIDENTIFAGGVTIAKSTDGGDTWLEITEDWPNVASNYLHADNHDLKFSPEDPSILYSANDGGLFRSSDGGNTWADLSDGLQITQFYRLGASSTDVGKILAGAQDNGVFLKDGSTWDMVGIGDGMECIVDPVNSDIMYFGTQYGQLWKTTNDGISWSEIRPSGTGAWETPFVMHPTNNLIIYYGVQSGIHKTINGGTSWTGHSIPNCTAQIQSLAVAPSDGNVIYASTFSQLFHSSNAGVTWTSIASGLPTVFASISYITVHDTDPNMIWVTFSGFASNKKVYKSVDAGITWENISGTLPNIPVNCVEFEHIEEEALYVGTDMGVYYFNTDLGAWINFNDGLPNVIINELEIHYASKKIRAATFGRGLWESDLMIPSGIKENQNHNSLNIYPNPTSSSFSIDLNGIGKGNRELQFFDSRGLLVFKITIEDELEAVTIDLSNLSAGLYFMELLAGKQIYSQKVLLK